MKSFFHILLIALLVVSISISLLANVKSSGFYIPDSIAEVTLRYRVVNNLIVLPVTINQNIEVNLVLDTGCRNLVLFGRRFQKLFPLLQQSRVQFSGLGNGNPVQGKVSLDNHVSIDAVIGTKIPVVIVPDLNLFGTFNQIHGVIGYDVFQKFEVEINPVARTITFRSASTATMPQQFTAIPIRIVDSRPILNCEMVFTKNNTHLCDLMIDTGSALGLLLKTTAIEKFDTQAIQPLGRGFNGYLYGIHTSTEKLLIKDLSFYDISTGIIQSPWHNYASLGMDVLKDYAIVLNYLKGYAGFKKVS